MNKWKWGIITAAVIAAWWGGCTYGIRSVIKTTAIDTAITRTVIDTVYRPVAVTEIHDSVIYRVRHDTLELPASGVVYLPSGTPDWVADVTNDYYTVRNYDTTIIRAGDTIQIADVVTRNAINRRWIRAVWNDTVITKITTLKPPRRFVGYFTVSGMFERKNIGAGLGIGLKNKNETVYQIEWIPVGQYKGFSGRIFIPIKIK